MISKTETENEIKMELFCRKYVREVLLLEWLLEVEKAKLSEMKDYTP